MPSKPIYYRPAHLGTPQERARKYDQARQSDKNFYSSRAWLSVRELKLRQQPLCEQCERAGRTTLAVHVHHMRPRKTHPELALNIGNLESLCIPCHNSQPQR